MAQPNDAGIGGGQLSAEERARREALRQSLLANAAKYAPKTPAAPRASATSSTAYDPLSSANTGKPAAARTTPRTVGATVAPSPEEIMRQRPAPVPAAPARPLIPTVAPRPSTSAGSVTGSTAYDPLSSANTGRPVNRPPEPPAAPPRAEIPSRGYNFTDGSYTGATPQQRAQEVDWAMLAAQATARENALRREREMQPAPLKVQASEMPVYDTDPYPGWWTPPPDFSQPATAERWTGQPAEQTGLPQEPLFSPPVVQYVEDRYQTRTEPGGAAWVNFSRQADAERARQAEAERYANLGMPTTAWEAEQYAQDPMTGRGSLPGTYMPYTEEELRAMQNRSDWYNPVFAEASRFFDYALYGPEKEVVIQPVPGTARTDDQGNPIPDTQLTVGAGFGLMVDALWRAGQVAAAGNLMAQQSQYAPDMAIVRSAEQQMDELKAAAQTELTQSAEALRDVNVRIAQAGAPTGPMLGPPEKSQVAPPPTLYDWFAEAKRNFGIVPVGPMTLDQTIRVAQRDPNYFSAVTIDGVNKAITDINRQAEQDARAARYLANVRPMTYGEWSQEAPTFYDALEQLGIVNGQGVPYPEMATLIASSGAEAQTRVLENFEMKAKLPEIRELRDQMLWNGSESGMALAMSLNSLILRLEATPYSDLVDLETNIPMELLENVLLDPLNLLDIPFGKIASFHLAGKVADATTALRTADNADDLATLSRLFRDAYKPWLEGGRVGDLVFPANAPADLVKLLPTANELRGPGSWLGRQFARTPETQVHLSANNLWMAMSNVLYGVDNVDDAIRILRTATEAPQEMIKGLSGLTSPTFRALADEDGLVRWGPGVLTNKTFVREMPIFQAGAARVIERMEKAQQAAMAAAKKAGTFYDGTKQRVNPLELLVNLNIEWERAARQLYGIAPIDPPANATKVAMRDLANGTAQVEWLDDADTVLRQLPPLPTAQARTQLNTLQAAMTEAKENPLYKAARVSAEVQRHIMSDMWLNLRPAHWVRNATAFTLALNVDGLYSFKSVPEMFEELGKKAIGGQMTHRLAEGSSGAGTLGELTVQHWTRKGWPKYNPLAWMAEHGAKVWTGYGQILGAVPYGEQAGYLTGYNSAFNRLFGGDWTTLTKQELNPLFASWGVDPDLAQAMVDKIVEVGRTGSKADVAQAARQMIHGAGQPFSVRGLGVADGVIPVDNNVRIVDAVNSLGRSVNGTAPRSAEQVQQEIRRVTELIRAEFDQMRHRPGAVLAEAMPQPSTVAPLATEATDTMARLVDDALADAQNAGITDPQLLAAIEQDAQEYARRLVEGETLGWEGVLDEMANVPDDPAGMVAAFDLLSQIYELKRMARQAVDELMAPVRAARTRDELDAAWAAKFAGTSEIYTKLADDLQAVFANSTDTLRRIAAGEEIPQQRDWWDVIARYLDFDARANLQDRGVEFGDMMQEDPAIVQKVIDANRAYVDSSYIQLYDVFRRYPSLDALDVLRLAQQQIDAEGARSAAFLRTQRQRIKHFDEAAGKVVGDLTKEEYYVIRNDTWRAVFDNQVIFNQAAARAIAAHALAMGSPTQLTWTDDFFGGTFQLIGPAVADPINNAIALTIDDIFETGAFDAATGKIADGYLAPRPLARQGRNANRWAITPVETETQMQALAVVGVTEKRGGDWYLLIRDPDAAAQAVAERGKFAWLARNVETGEIAVFGSPNPQAPIPGGQGSNARVPGAVMQDFDALVEGRPFPDAGTPNAGAAPTPPPDAGPPPAAPDAPPAGYRNAFTDDEARARGIPVEGDEQPAAAPEPLANVPTVPQEVLDAKAVQSDPDAFEQAVDGEIGKSPQIEPRPEDDVIPDGMGQQDWIDAKASVDARMQAAEAEANIAQEIVIDPDALRQPLRQAQGNAQGPEAPQIAPRGAYLPRPMNTPENRAQSAALLQRFNRGEIDTAQLNAGLAALQPGKTVDASIAHPLDLIEDYKARPNMNQYLAWDNFVQDRRYRPEISEDEFYRLFNGTGEAPPPAPIARPPVTVDVLNQLAAGAGIGTSKADGSPTYQHLINAINKAARDNNAGWQLPSRTIVNSKGKPVKVTSSADFRAWVKAQPAQAEQAAEWLAAKVESAAKLALRQAQGPEAAKTAKTPKPKKGKAAATPAPQPAPATMPDPALDVDFTQPLPQKIQQRMGAEGNAYMEARRQLPPGGSGAGYPAEAPFTDTGRPGRPYTPPAPAPAAAPSPAPDAPAPVGVIPAIADLPQAQQDGILRMIARAQETNKTDIEINRVGQEIAVSGMGIDNLTGSRKAQRRTYVGIGADGKIDTTFTAFVESRSTPPEVLHRVGEAAPRPSPLAPDITVAPENVVPAEAVPSMAGGAPIPQAQRVNFLSGQPLDRRSRAQDLLDAKPTRNAPQTRREMVEDAYRQGMQAEQRQGNLWYIGDRNVTTTEAEYLNYLHASAGEYAPGAPVAAAGQGIGAQQAAPAPYVSEPDFVNITPGAPAPDVYVDANGVKVYRQTWEQVQAEADANIARRAAAQQAEQAANVTAAPVTPAAAKTYTPTLHRGTVGRGRLTYIEISDGFHSEILDAKTLPDGKVVIETRFSPKRQFANDEEALRAITQQFKELDQAELSRGAEMGRGNLDLPQARKNFMAGEAEIKRTKAKGILDTEVNYGGNIQTRRENLEQSFFRGYRVGEDTENGKPVWALFKPNGDRHTITKTEADYFKHLEDTAAKQTPAAAPPPSTRPSASLGQRSGAGAVGEPVEPPAARTVPLPEMPGSAADEAAGVAAAPAPQAAAQPRLLSAFMADPEIAQRLITYRSQFDMRPEAFDMMFDKWYDANARKLLEGTEIGEVLRQKRAAKEGLRDSIEQFYRQSDETQAASDAITRAQDDVARGQAAAKIAEENAARQVRRDRDEFYTNKTTTDWVSSVQGYAANVARYADAQTGKGFNRLVDQAQEQISASYKLQGWKQPTPKELKRMATEQTQKDVARIQSDIQRNLKEIQDGYPWIADRFLPFADEVLTQYGVPNIERRAAKAAPSPAAVTPAPAPAQAEYPQPPGPNAITVTAPVIDAPVRQVELGELAGLPLGTGEAITPTPATAAGKPASKAAFLDAYNGIDDQLEELDRQRYIYGEIDHLDYMRRMDEIEQQRIDLLLSIGADGTDDPTEAAARAFPDWDKLLARIGDQYKPLFREKMDGADWSPIALLEEAFETKNAVSWEEGWQGVRNTSGKGNRKYVTEGYRSDLIDALLDYRREGDEYSSDKVASLLERAALDEVLTPEAVKAFWPSLAKEMDEISTRRAAVIAEEAAAEAAYAAAVTAQAPASTGMRQAWEMTQNEFYRAPRDTQFIDTFRHVNRPPTPQALLDAERAKNEARIAARKAGVSDSDLDTASPWGVTSKVKRKAYDKYRAAYDEYMAVYERSRVQMQNNLHRAIVQDAIERGQPVPANVLAEYPDLTAPPAPRTAAPNANFTSDFPGAVERAKALWPNQSDIWNVSERDFLDLAIRKQLRTDQLLAMQKQAEDLVDSLRAQLETAETAGKTKQASSLSKKLQSAMTERDRMSRMLPDDLVQRADWKELKAAQDDILRRMWAEAVIDANQRGIATLGIPPRHVDRAAEIVGYAPSVSRATPSPAPAAANSTLADMKRAAQTLVDDLDSEYESLLMNGQKQKADALYQKLEAARKERNRVFGLSPSDVEQTAPAAMPAQAATPSTAIAFDVGAPDLEIRFENRDSSTFKKAIRQEGDGYATTVSAYDDSGALIGGVTLRRKVGDAGWRLDEADIKRLGSTDVQQPVMRALEDQGILKPQKAPATPAPGLTIPLTADDLEERFANRVRNGLQQSGDNYVIRLPVYDGDGASGELIAQVELLRRPEDAGWWTNEGHITNRGGPDVPKKIMQALTDAGILKPRAAAPPPFTLAEAAVGQRVVNSYNGKVYEVTGAGNGIVNLRDVKTGEKVVELPESKRFALEAAPAPAPRPVTPPPAPVIEPVEMQPATGARLPTYVNERGETVVTLPVVTPEEKAATFVRNLRNKFNIEVDDPQLLEWQNALAAADTQLEALKEQRRALFDAKIKAREPQQIDAIGEQIAAIDLEMQPFEAAIKEAQEGISDIITSAAYNQRNARLRAMPPRDRVLAELEYAAEKRTTKSDKSLAKFDIPAAIKRIKDNPDLPVVEFTVPVPGNTATDVLGKAEQDAIKARLKEAEALLRGNQAGAVTIHYGRWHMTVIDPVQAQELAKGLGTRLSASIPEYSGVTGARTGGFASIVDNATERPGAFEPEIEIWENAIPMQGRAMAPHPAILDNVARKYKMGKVAEDKAFTGMVDGQPWYSDGYAMFAYKPKEWAGVTPKPTTNPDANAQILKDATTNTIPIEPLGLVDNGGKTAGGFPGIIFGTDDGKIKGINARYYAGVMQAANGKPVTWVTTNRPHRPIVALVDGKPFAVIMPYLVEQSALPKIAKYFYPQNEAGYLTMYGGLGAIDPIPAMQEIYQTMLRYWRKPRQPVMGDVALHQVTSLNDAEDRILAALPALAQPRRNNFTAAQANALIDAVDKRLLPAFDDAVSRASYGAQKVADTAMLNYRDRRGIDSTLALILPYHYFYTRGGATWLRRIARKPSVAAMYYDIQKAIETENKQAHVPARLKGTIPIWNYPGGQIRIANPLNTMMPFYMYMPDPFQNEEGDTDIERMWTALKNFAPGVMPVYDVAMAAVLDQIDPLPSGETRVARYTNLRNYIPLAGTAADAAMALGGIVTPTNLGGDPFDTYRIKRTAGVMAQQGAFSDEMARYVIQLSVNLEGGGDPWANIPADQTAAVRAAYIATVNQTGRDKLLMGSGAGYLLGANLYNFPYAERELQSAQDLWRYSGFGEQNPAGSAAQRSMVMEQNPALGAYMARSATPGSPYQPGQQAQANALYNQLDPLYAQQQAIEDRMITQSGYAVPGDALRAATAPIQAQIDAARAQYPNLPAPTGKPRSGSNPAELAEWMLRQAVPQGGPVYPGKDAPKAELQAYYDARDAWEKEKLATFQRNLTTVMAGNDPAQDEINFELYRLTAGKDTATLLREYGSGYYDSPTRREYDARNAERQAATSAKFDAAESLILQEFGQAGLDVYKGYAATEQAGREAYKKAHPELKALNLAAYNPEQYRQAVELFGKDAILAWAKMPPSDGSEAASAARAAYNDANPGAYLMNAWMNGRPTPFGETIGPWAALPSQWGMEYQYNFGKDFNEAATRFGADIWQIVAGYKRGWSSKEKAAYFDKYPQLGDFFDWWNELLPDDGKGSSSSSSSGRSSSRGYSSYKRYYRRSGYRRRSYGGYSRSYGGGGWGGGGGWNDEEKAPWIDDVDPRWFDRSLWNTESALRRWEPPRPTDSGVERWRPARYGYGGK